MGEDHRPGPDPRPAPSAAVRAPELWVVIEVPEPVRSEVLRRRDALDLVEEGYRGAHAGRLEDALAEFAKAGTAPMVVDHAMVSGTAARLDRLTGNLAIAMLPAVRLSKAKLASGAARSRSRELLPFQKEKRSKSDRAARSCFPREAVCW